MSIQLMTRVWSMESVDKEKLILLSLADQANDDGVCWPDMATIARRCSVSVKTVQRAIAALVTLGLLSVKSEYGRSSIYHLHLDGKPAVDLVPDLDKLSKLKKDNLSANLDNLSANLDNLSNLHTRTQKNPKETPTRVREDGFEFVWKAYPRKTCKAEALKAWLRLGGGEALTGRMLAWIAVQQGSDQWQRGIVPHLRTVLQQKRFDDPLPSDAGAETAAPTHRCTTCGEHATVIFEGNRYCRTHNPARM